MSKYGIHRKFRHPRYFLGQVVWCIGSTVRNSGTQYPNCYYLPLKVEIKQSSLENAWDDGHKLFYYYYRYQVFRPSSLKRRSTTYRGNPITHTAYDGGAENWCLETEISANKSKILKECHNWNKYISK
jgi:hypothetical protein